jgi:hypothetical protein
MDPPSTRRQQSSDIRAYRLLVERRTGSPNPDRVTQILVVVEAELTAADQAPIIHDAGSSPGSDAVMACVRQRAAEKLRSPATTPAPFVRVPLPLVTSEVS